MAQLPSESYCELRVGMVAAEVALPLRAYPRALWGTLALTTALYVLPLGACVATVGGWEEWDAGQFTILGRQLGGPLLASALTASSIVSMMGVLCTLMCPLSPSRPSSYRPTYTYI